MLRSMIFAAILFVLVVCLFGCVQYIGTKKAYYNDVETFIDTDKNGN